MAAVTVRNLDDEVKRRLHIRAAGHGRSMEAEVRAILEAAVSDLGESESMLAVLLDRFREIGGVELELPARSTPVRAAELA